MKTFLELGRDSMLALVFHVAPRFANVLIFILVSRLAGPKQAGIFSLATTYLLIITTVMRGLDDLLIRQVTRDLSGAANYLANFLVIRLVLSIGLYVGLLFVVVYVLNYPASTTVPIVILTLSVIPDSLAFVGQSVLLGQRRFGAPAAILAAANLFKLTVGAVVLLRGGGLLEVAWIWLAGSVLAMSAMLVIAVRRVGGLRNADWFSWVLLQTYWRPGLSFMVITTLAAFESQTDTVLLSVFRGEAEVGWYGAATTITFSLLMLAQAYRFAVYPIMTRYAKDAPENLVVLFQKSVHYMGVMSIPMVLGIILLAPQIVQLIFGPKFAPAVPLLQVLVVSLLFYFIGEPFNRLMLAKDRQRHMVVQLVISASVNVIINLVLIPRVGAIGASAARTCSAALYFALSYSYVYRNLIYVIRLKSLVRPMLAAVVMSVIVIILAPTYFALAIIFGFIVYVTALWIFGGVLKDDKNLFKNTLSLKIREVYSARDNSR